MSYVTYQGKMIYSAGKLITNPTIIPSPTVPFINWENQNFSSLSSSGLNINSCSGNSASARQAYMVDIGDDLYWYLEDKDFMLVADFTSYTLNSGTDPFISIFRSGQPGVPIYQQQIVGIEEMNFSINIIGEQTVSIFIRNFEYTGFAPVPFDTDFSFDLTLSTTPNIP